MINLSPTYQLRARTCGVLDWGCPFCAHLNHDRITRTTWRVQCAGKSYRRWFAVGVVFRTLPHAGHPLIPPVDIILPIADLDEWHRGDPVNKLVISPEDETP